MNLKRIYDLIHFRSKSTMKIQIDLDAQLWALFKARVTENGKMLRDVVPTVFEPALRNYLDTSQDLKACDVCGNKVERRFSSNGTKVCYDCWKASMATPLQ